MRRAHAATLRIVRRHPQSEFERQVQSCARATRSPPLTPRGRIVSQAQRRSRTARSSSFTYCSTATSHRTSWRARSEHMRIEATKTRRVKALNLRMLPTVSSDDVF